MKIIRNIAKCKICEDTIESRHRHDYVSCKCGAIFIDGGQEYQRYGWNPKLADGKPKEDIIDFSQSVYEE